MVLKQGFRFINLALDQNFIFKPVKIFTTMNVKRGLIILIILLLLLLSWIGYTAYKGNKAQLALEERNTELSSEIDDLNQLKEKLSFEVDSLQFAYELLATENEELQGSKEAAEKKAAQKDAIISRLQKRSQTESNNLKAQIEQLLADKTQLEYSINNLQMENDSLRMVTGQLTADLAASKSENQALADLNATIQEELKRLTLSNFKASAFRVEVEKKQTQSHRQVKKGKKDNRQLRPDGGQYQIPRCPEAVPCHYR